MRALEISVSAWVSYHPDHEVGKEGYPESGGQEGDEVPALPSRLATVGNGAVQQEAQRPGQQPLQANTPAVCREKGNDHTLFPDKHHHYSCPLLNY